MRIPPIKSLSLILSINLFFISCSNDDPEPGCYQEEGRRIVQIIDNAKGTVELQEGCFGIFTIKPDNRFDKNPIGILGPCNLDVEFQTDGQRVIFSGYIYETFDTEDICADFFELTAIMPITDN